MLQTIEEQGIANTDTIENIEHFYGSKNDRLQLSSDVATLSINVCKGRQSEARKKRNALKSRTLSSLARTIIKARRSNTYGLHNQ